MLSQLGVVYSIPFPNLYSNLLRWVGVIEFNLPEILPFGCVVTFSFYESLLFRTLLLPSLGVIYAVMRVLKVSQRAVDLLGGLLFVVLFLIYPSTSAAIFATFQCEELDDGTTWLRADLSIDCQSDKHSLFWGYAALMALIYPMGTPLLYYVMLRRCKPTLDKLQVNQALRIQLLTEVRVQKDYEASRVSVDSRQVPWLLSKAERAKLPLPTRRKLRNLEREEIIERKKLPASVTKLLKGYEVRTPLDRFAPPPLLEPSRLFHPAHPSARAATCLVV